MIVPASQAIPVAPEAEIHLVTIIIQKKTNNHNRLIIELHEQQSDCLNWIWNTLTSTPSRPGKPWGGKGRIKVSTPGKCYRVKPFYPLDVSVLQGMASPWTWIEQALILSRSTHRWVTREKTRYRCFGKAHWMVSYATAVAVTRSKSNWTPMGDYALRC